MLRGSGFRDLRSRDVGFRGLGCLYVRVRKRIYVRVHIRI